MRKKQKKNEKNKSKKPLQEVINHYIDYMCASENGLHIEEIHCLFCSKDHGHYHGDENLTNNDDDVLRNVETNPLHPPRCCC